MAPMKKTLGCLRFRYRTYFLLQYWQSNQYLPVSVWPSLFILVQPSAGELLFAVDDRLLLTPFAADGGLLLPLFRGGDELPLARPPEGGLLFAADDELLFDLLPADFGLFLPLFLRYDELSLTPSAKGELFLAAIPGSGLLSVFLVIFFLGVDSGIYRSFTFLVGVGDGVPSPESFDGDRVGSVDFASDDLLRPFFGIFFKCSNHTWKYTDKKGKDYNKANMKTNVNNIPYCSH